jgi:hypothetical protein
MFLYLCIYIYISDSCFYNTVALNAATFKIIQGVSNVFECQFQCQKNPDCNYFKYGKIGTNPCYLKTLRDNYPNIQSALLSGPKYCQEVVGKKLTNELLENN